MDRQADVFAIASFSSWALQVAAQAQARALHACFEPNNTEDAGLRLDTCATSYNLAETSMRDAFCMKLYLQVTAVGSET
jgi:hypothetical protein